MNTKCCTPVAVVAVELDDRHVPDELPTRRRLEQRGEALERVRRAERVVLDVGREHVEPAVLHELARVRHVPRAQRVQLDEVGNALRKSCTHLRRMTLSFDGAKPTRARARESMVMTDAIEPFRIHVDDAVLDDLRDRLARTRFPDQIDDTGWEYGIPIDYLRELVDVLARRLRLARGGSAAQRARALPHHHRRPVDPLRPRPLAARRRAPAAPRCTAGRARSSSSST